MTAGFLNAQVCPLCRMAPWWQKRVVPASVWLPSVSRSVATPMPAHPPRGPARGGAASVSLHLGTGAGTWWRQGQVLLRWERIVVVSCQHIAGTSTPAPWCTPTSGCTTTPIRPLMGPGIWAVSGHVANCTARPAGDIWGLHQAMPAPVCPASTAGLTQNHRARTRVTRVADVWPLGSLLVLSPSSCEAQHHRHLLCHGRCLVE